MIDLVRDLNNFDIQGFLPLLHNDSVIGYVNDQFKQLLNTRPFTITDEAVVYTHSNVEEDTMLIRKHFEMLRDNAETPREIRNELRGWRNEEYGVYSLDNILLFRLERAAAGILGIPTYGIHLTAYTDNYKIWIPRRSYNKQTYPGMLDNTVAGGIAFGDSVIHTVIKECEEEANLPADTINNGIKSTGVVTYFYQKNNIFAQPEIQYIFDLQLPDDVIPKPNDGEVESFKLMDVAEIKDALLSRQFKPNCALVMIEFFMRHGIITPDIEEYVELSQSMHRQLPLSNIFTPNHRERS